MRLGLGLGIGGNRGGGAAPYNPPPSDIAWAGSHTIAENAALGSVVGGALSAVDPNDTVTFSLPVDADGLFGIGAGGTTIIVTGVLDYEAATSHSITVRATDSDGGFYDEAFTVTVTDVNETPPEEPLPEGGTVIIDEPVGEPATFTNPPVVTEVDGSTKIHGKKAAATQGKFLYDLGAPLVGKIYTMRYDPDFSLLSNTGKDTAVGFVLKHGNDFHFIGLKGDGSTGLKAYRVSGANKWNSGTGLTETDDGAPAHGTQAGPNMVQIEFYDDGTYTFRTSGDDGASWTDEVSGITPVPFASFDEATQFGPGALFWSTDTGSFSIAIEAWISADAFTVRQVMVPDVGMLTTSNRQLVTPGGIVTG